MKIAVLRITHKNVFITLNRQNFPTIKAYFQHKKQKIGKWIYTKKLLLIKDSIKKVKKANH